MLVVHMCWGMNVCMRVITCPWVWCGLHLERERCRGGDEEGGWREGEKRRCGLTAGTWRRSQEDERALVAALDESATHISYESQRAYHISYVSTSGLERA